MRRLFPILALASAFLLSACGPAKVNLYAVKAGFDRHKAGIDQAQSVLNVRKAELSEILATTRRPDSAPYPDLQAQVDTMAASLQGMRAASAKVDAFKPKFDAYAQGKNIVSEEDQAAWAEYQGVMAEYNAIQSELNYQSSGFNNAQRRYADLMKANKVQKVDLADLRAEVDRSTRAVVDGVEQMDMQLRADRKALDFARNQGGDNASLVEKDATLQQMERMMPGLRLASSSLLNSRSSTLGSLRGRQTFWIGPGMNEGTLRAVDSFRSVAEQYDKDRQTWDDLQRDFESGPAPTPVPTAAP